LNNDRGGDCEHARAAGGSNPHGRRGARGVSGRRPQGGSRTARNPKRNPFPILCGTSAGAINAAALACGADDFSAAVDTLLGVWGEFRAERVYRTDIPDSRTRAAGSVRSRSSTAATRVAARQHAPAGTRARTLELERIQDNDRCGRLSTPCPSTARDTPPARGLLLSRRAGSRRRERSQRSVPRRRITLDILMAWRPPVIFPAVKVHREFFGDGSMRRSPRSSPRAPPRARTACWWWRTGRRRASRRGAIERLPSLAQIAGHALNSIFLGQPRSRYRRLQRINRTDQPDPPGSVGKPRCRWRHVEVLVMNPSEPIERVAARHVRELPRTVRFLWRAIGAMNRNGSNTRELPAVRGALCHGLIELGLRTRWRVARTCWPFAPDTKRTFTPPATGP